LSELVELVSRLEWLVKDMERLEEQGRARAYRRDELPRNDSEWALDVSRVSNEVADALLKLSEQLEERGESASRLGRLYFFADDVGAAAYRLSDVASQCLRDRRSRGECVVDEWSKSYFKAMDEAYERATGKRCTWLLGVKEPYTLSAAINDLTSCFHRLMEEVRKITGKYEIEGGCLFEADVDPVLKEACKTFDKAEFGLFDMGLLSENDHGAVSGFARDGILELRVGSAPGHASRIDLNRGTLEYYDTDEAVNKAMKEILEEIGLRCEAWEGGVTCKGVTRDNATKAATLLAASTSMDLRLEDPESWWGENLENMPEECRNIKDSIKREACAIKKVIAKITGIKL